MRNKLKWMYITVAICVSYFIHQQEVLNKNYLLTKLRRSDSFFNSRSLDVFITKLRKKLADDHSVQIIYIRGAGYKLVY